MGQYDPLRYRGYVYDTETGLYYLQSRYYDPEMGRFISADLVSCLGADGSPLSYNLFIYCGNNPINRIDSTGMFWKELWDTFVQTIQQSKGYFAGAAAVS